VNARLLARAQVGQRGYGVGDVGRVGETDDEYVAADGRFELCSGSVGSDPSVVDHCDLLREPIGLLEILGGEQHGGALEPQFLDDAPELLS
jgi:hypothetical protein